MLFAKRQSNCDCIDLLQVYFRTTSRRIRVRFFLKKKMLEKEVNEKTIPFVVARGFDYFVCCGFIFCDFGYGAVCEAVRCRSIAGVFLFIALGFVLAGYIYLALALKTITENRC